MEEWRYNKFVAETEDGGVAVLEPGDEFKGSKDDFIASHFLEYAENWAELEPIRMPLLKEYAGSWRLKDGRIEIDLEKAKEIHIDILREQREELLRKLDIESLRCLEEDDFAALECVKKRKQRLRDMPTDKCFDVDSFEELTQAIPDYME